MASTTQINPSDINTEFWKDISLYRLIGQQQAQKTLMTWIDDYYYSDLSSSNKKIGAVLIVGQTASTVARAFSNSYGNTDFRYCEGVYLGNGLCYSEFFLAGSDYASYFIHQVERCNPYLFPEFSRIVNDHILREPERIGIQQEQRHFYNRLIIFSTHNLEMCDNHLIDSMDLVLELKPYSLQDIKAIINQRLCYMKINAEDRNIVDVIASVSNGNPKIAIDLLRWAFRCCRAKGHNKLKECHVNQALRLYKNE